MLKTILVVSVCVAAGAVTLGCGSDSEASAGSAHDGSADGNTPDGSADGSAGDGAVTDGATDGAVTDGGGAGNQITGSLGGTPMDAQGSTATFTQAPGRAYVSVSISEWAADCKTSQVCGSAQINFTLYALKGKLPDVKPGTYPAGDSLQGGLTYQLVGAAGRYGPACEGNFPKISGGSITLTSVAPTVVGSVDLVLDDSTALKGNFDALDCTIP